MKMRLARGALGLVLAMSLFSAASVVAARPVAASGCTPQAWLTGYTDSQTWGIIRANTQWTGCSTAYHNTLAIYNETGPGDWSDVYGETLAPTTNGYAISIPTGVTGWWCPHNLGDWRAHAYVGNVTVWGSVIICP